MLEFCKSAVHLPCIFISVYFSLFPVVHPSCGKFKFSLAALNSTEFVITAELMLYATRHPFSSTYFIEVVAQPSNRVNSSTPEGRSIVEKLRIIQEVKMPMAGYVTFPVAEMTKALIKLGKLSNSFLLLFCF